MSGRGPGSARLLLYLGLCHMGLGAMVLAFSFTSMAFTSSARVRQSCPFWAGFFVSMNLSNNRTKTYVRDLYKDFILSFSGGCIRNCWNYLMEETSYFSGMYVFDYFDSFLKPH